MTCHRPNPRGLLLAIFAVSQVAICGCSREEASSDLKKAEAAAEGAAREVTEDVGAAVEEGEKMASELGEKAKAYLAPLKEKFSNLEELKKSPEQLKTAVAGLIESIEQKAEGVKLPETVSTTLAKVKEKLIALRDYLEGEYEQAKIDEHVHEIMESVESGLGLSKK
ncbi:hypothetical protein NG895_02940 [Aeoliella sp. ICT_H6.2]|uniref:Lipoprotein n=1 Tax=Aeoliella straminimaris TaxID=2954799 RepID=A0A9X2F616_9BACT|nr:hypothetical protein [Aeoliella straminimaris]MCO6042855.1 hypothetical protein [Aeoliella straminimaris]